MEKSPIYLSNTNRTNVRTMKKEIDDLMDTYKLKQEFQKDKVYLQAIKSYVKTIGNLLIIFSRTFTTLILSIRVSERDAGGFLMLNGLLCLEIGSSR